MKRILITGGAGFIGSHLCERLLARGDEVLCVDNFFTSRRQNIMHMLGNKMFELMRHDITWPLYVEVDQIYNLACPASPVHYQFDPVQTTKTSVHGAINMLGLAKRVKARILQASTSEVYGDPAVHPQRKTYWGNVNPIGPRACYDEGKRCAETLFFDYHRQNKLQIRVIRIFNTYGPRMHPNDGRVVSNFIMQALHGEPITLYGTASQTRSFCYVDDLVTGMIAMMDQDELVGPVNLGNPRGVHHPRPGDDGEGALRLEIRDRFPPAPPGRPGPAQTGYLARETEARLGADHPPPRGSRPHDRLLPLKSCIVPVHVFPAVPLS